MDQRLVEFESLKGLIMCKCTPEIRTPFCGKPGCEPPDQKSIWTEPEITINGHRLSTAQSMTVRVALSGFMMELSSEGLGDDEMGRRICSGYMDRLREVIGFIVK